MKQKMIILQPFTYSPTSKLTGFVRPQNQFPNAVLCSSAFKTRSSTNVSLKCLGIKNENTHEQGFSVLKSDVPCDSGDLWSTMALYLFTFHVPLSFGGLSVIAQILHQPVLDLQTEALALLAIQTSELVGVLLLLRRTVEPQYNFGSFFRSFKLSKERNWLLASGVGFGFLILLVYLTSLLADILIGPKDVNNPILKEILLSSNISEMACILAYCVVTPLLEETVYRGFLLSSLASKMKWQQAVVISSAVFSAAHFSGENSLQLFIIGCVLGCSYCWTGNLASPIMIHSLYNAVTLIVTFLS